MESNTMNHTHVEFQQGEDWRITWIMSWLDWIQDSQQRLVDVHGAYSGLTQWNRHNTHNALWELPLRLIPQRALVSSYKLEFKKLNESLP